MNIGSNIRKLRLSVGITQKQLAEKIGVSQTHMSQMEKGNRRVDADWLPKIAVALGCRTEDLVADHSGQQDNYLRVARSFSPEEWYEVPLLDPSAVVCAGDGNGGMHGIILESSQTISVPREWLGLISIDTDKQPFALRVEGESMAEAGISDGVEVIVNPAEEVREGDVALVCFGTRGDWSIKWTHFHRDGSIELRASSAKYPTKTFLKEDVEAGFIRIIGRVMRFTGTPKRNA
ncbi:MAG: S24 family peptidase [Synergistota bacterium]|nr:S24 family peptidase [Synergistota bacterium]